MKIRKSVLKECIREVLVEVYGKADGSGVPEKRGIKGIANEIDNVGDLLNWLDMEAPSSFKKYSTGESYDSVQYKIPLKVMKNIGFDKRKLDKIEKNTGNYDGGFNYEDNDLLIHGGA
tara:strand:+ start:1806 stop:2159 length:354 start_codon:yes stop_codon:yes gene_type:complete